MRGGRTTRQLTVRAPGSLSVTAGCVAAAGGIAAAILAVMTWGLARSAGGAVFGLLMLAVTTVRSRWVFGERVTEPVEEVAARRERSSSSDQAVLQAILAAFPPNELEALQRQPSAARAAPAIERNLRSGTLLHLRFIEVGLEECRGQLMSAASEWIDAMDRDAATTDHARRIVETVRRLSGLV